MHKVFRSKLLRRLIPAGVVLAGLLSTLQILGQVATSPTQTTDPSPGDGHGWVIEGDLTDPRGIQLPNGQWFKPEVVKRPSNRISFLTPALPTPRWRIPLGTPEALYWFAPPPAVDAQVMWPLLTPEIRAQVRIIPLNHVEVQ